MLAMTNVCVHSARDRTIALARDMRHVLGGGKSESWENSVRLGKSGWETLVRTSVAYLNIGQFLARAPLYV